MAFEKITYELKDNVAIIALNEPATMNAATPATGDELLTAFEFAADNARCTILTGNGRGFCSGANLSGDAMKPRADGRKIDVGEQLDTHFNPLIMAMKEHPHPVITAVNGAAAGFGCSLALMGDLIMASEKAIFLQAFRKIGLVPDGGSSYLLPRMIGRVRAMEMALLGDKITAEQALEWGMINRVYAPDDLMPETMKIATELANGPTQALGLMRSLFWDSTERDFNEQLHLERAAQKKAGQTEDFMEGVAAFFEKRPANFTGK